MEYEFTKLTLDEIEGMIDKFVGEHADNDDGTISDDEYDKIFDHLGTCVRKVATYDDEGGDADFSGYRYVDQITHIQLVPDGGEPHQAIAAALDAVQTSHRPFAVQFDYYPDSILVLPPNLVFSTFDKSALNPPG